MNDKYFALFTQNISHARFVPFAFTFQVVDFNYLHSLFSFCVKPISRINVNEVAKNISNDSHKMLTSFLNSQAVSIPLVLEYTYLYKSNNI